MIAVCALAYHVRADPGAVEGCAQDGILIASIFAVHHAIAQQVRLVPGARNALSTARAHHLQWQEKDGYSDTQGYSDIQSIVNHTALHHLQGRSDTQ